MNFSDAFRDPHRQAQARQRLQHDGYVHIPDAFDESAARALLANFANLPWLATFRTGGTDKQLHAADLASWEPPRRAAMLAQVHRQASSAFQYFYDTYRISYECERGSCVAPAFVDYYQTVNSELGLETMRSITGEAGINCVDAQATRYLPGQFLTEHDDQTADGARLFAYVLNLTPTWRTDWGGLLMLLEEDGHVRKAFSPKWNALNIFRVPQRHAVSFVTPFAAAARYSITGWMRTAP